MNLFPVWLMKWVVLELLLKLILTAANVLLTFMMDPSSSCCDILHTMVTRLLFLGDVFSSKVQGLVGT